jgi:hypothetical protein
MPHKAPCNDSDALCSQTSPRSLSGVNGMRGPNTRTSYVLTAKSALPHPESPVGKAIHRTCRPSIHLAFALIAVIRPRWNIRSFKVVMQTGREYVLGVTNVVKHRIGQDVEGEAPERSSTPVTRGTFRAGCPPLQSSAAGGGCAARVPISRSSRCPPSFHTHHPSTLTASSSRAYTVTGTFSSAVHSDRETRHASK